jgi:hypothetical protein
MLAHRFENDPCEVLTRVHAGHPVWIRLELAKGAADDCRMRRHPGRMTQIALRCATRKDLSLRSERRSEQPTGPVSDMATTRPSGSLPAADNADGISPATVSSFADDSGAKMLGLPLLELLGKQSPTPL